MVVPPPPTSPETFTVTGQTWSPHPLPTSAPPPAPPPARLRVDSQDRPVAAGLLPSARHPLGLSVLWSVRRSFLFKARPYSTVGMGRVGLALAPRWTRVPLSSCERHCCEHGCTGLLPCRVFAIGGSAGSLRRCPDAAPPAVHGCTWGFMSPRAP